MKSRNKYFIVDVDGVMATGQFIYSKEGKLYKIFGPHDTDGIKMLEGKIEIAFITADNRGFQITKKRIVDDMEQTLNLVTETDRYKYLNEKYGLKNIIYMGDGYYDAPILRGCYYGISPNNARVEAKKASDYVTPSNSGDGAVLDACLRILELLHEN